MNPPDGLTSVEDLERPYLQSTGCEEKYTLHKRKRTEARADQLLFFFALCTDDQILLQLGAHGSLADSQKQQYVNGLRQLLTDFRDRKIKDFDTISRGIIEYRAQFTDDKSKILPLGNVSI